jgi:hypothetical protein
MAKLLITLILASVMVISCSSQNNKFDLSKITFKENINLLISINNVSLTAGISEAKTIFGYERFESSARNFLNFEGVQLDGIFNNKKNKVVLHYSEIDSVLKMYEIEIYTKKECSDLVNLLEQKLGKSYLEENMQGYTDAEGSTYDNTIYKRVWQDKESDISYLLQHSYEDVKAKTSPFVWLTVINNKSKELYPFIADFKNNWYGDYLKCRAKKEITYSFDDYAKDEKQNGYEQYLLYIIKK